MKIIRWILTPVVAVAAAVVAYLIMTLVAAMDAFPRGVIMDFIWPVATFGIMGFSFVSAPTALSPTRNKRIVATVFAAIIVTFSILALIYAISSSQPFGMAYIGIVAIIIGAIISAIISDTL